MSDSFAAPWTVAFEALLSMGFSRQGYWSGLPFPSPEYLPDSGIKLVSPALQEDSFPPSHQGIPNKDCVCVCVCVGMNGYMVYIYLFLWLHWFLIVGHGIFIVEHGLSCSVACGILVPQPRIKHHPL